jgi:hypothetical protein
MICGRREFCHWTTNASKGVRFVSADVHVCALVAASTNGFQDDFEYVKEPLDIPNVCASVCVCGGGG